MSLRPYQERAVGWCLDTWSSLRSAHRRTSVVVQGPTGCGKGTMMAALEPDLVIAPGIDLVRQLTARIPSARVLTVQELAARLRRGEPLPEGRRVCLDEARWVAAPGWGAAADWYLERGCEVALFDATPATSTGQGLGRWAEALYQVASMKELIHAGYLCPFRVMAPGEPQRELCATPYEAWSLETPGQSTVIFCRDKAHASATVDDFRKGGVAADLITDDTPPKERARIIKGLEVGWCNVAICAQLLRQGIDVPRVSTIILARAVDSYPLRQQAIGRGGRPFPGKSVCTVLDLRGSVHKHGLPDADMTWSLEGEAVRLTNPLPSCVQCSQCGAWHEGGICALCGGAPVPPPP